MSKVIILIIVFFFIAWNLYRLFGEVWYIKILGREEREKTVWRVASNFIIAKSALNSSPEDAKYLVEVKEELLNNSLKIVKSISGDSGVDSFLKLVHDYVN
jgi:hypothetical protein